MAKLKVNVKINDKKIRKHLNELLDDKTKLECHNLLAKTIDPWVPFREGPLSQTVEIEPDYIKYIQPYARYQYYGLEFNHTKEFHQLASAMWDKVALSVKGDEFNEQITKILKRRMKELYENR